MLGRGGGVRDERGGYLYYILCSRSSHEASLMCKSCDWNAMEDVQHLPTYPVSNAYGFYNIMKYKKDSMHFHTVINAILYTYNLFILMFFLLSHFIITFVLSHCAPSYW